jgi:hypothetical protein
MVGVPPGVPWEETAVTYPVAVISLASHSSIPILVQMISSRPRPLGRDPVFLPQRSGLLAAAKRVEGVGSDAGAGLGPRVLLAKSIMVSSKCTMSKRDCLLRLTRF